VHRELGVNKLGFNLRVSRSTFAISGDIVVALAPVAAAGGLPLPEDPEGRS